MPCFNRTLSARIYGGGREGEQWFWTYLTMPLTFVKIKHRSPQHGSYRTMRKSLLFALPIVVGLMLFPPHPKHG